MRRALALLCLLPLAVGAEPLTLLEAYDRSLRSDPAFQGAGFDYLASQQEVAIGRAGLLPRLSAGARSGDTQQLSGRDTDTGEESERYGTTTLSLSARQPLFDAAAYAGYQQGNARSQLGSASFQDASQELFNRVIEAYFEAARQSNELKLAEQQRAAIEGLTQQTRRLYEAGDGTITDLDEAQARLDLVMAQQIEYQARLQAALRTLAGRTGTPVETIQTMHDELPPQAPLAAERDLQYWQHQARLQAPRLDASRAAVSVAEAELKRERAGHYPSLAMVGEYSDNDQENLTEDFQRQSSYYLGLSLDVPLYAGGGVSASVRRSQHALSSASARLDNELQTLLDDIERDYLGVTSGYLKCRALQTAVRSNQRALESAQKGYQAGVRSTVDILNAQQVLFAARRDLLNTKLLMLQSYVSLHSRTGQMHRGILEQVQALF